MRQKRLYLIMSGMQIGGEIWHVLGKLPCGSEIDWSDKEHTACNLSLTFLCISNLPIFMDSECDVKW